jgi:hypothetical protein
VLGRTLKARADECFGSKGFVEAGNHPGFFLTREYWSRIPAITGE